MTKTAAKSVVETAEIVAFDPSKATDQIRAFAEKGVEQSKQAYAKMKTGAEDAQKALEATYETVKAVSGDVSMKTISAMRDNAAAGFDHLEALVAAKSLSEVLELQTAYIRRRFEMTVEQAKDMQATVSKAVEDVAKPTKGLFEKAVKELKVA